MIDSKLDQDSFYESLNNYYETHCEFCSRIPFINYSSYSTHIGHNEFVVYEDWWRNKPKVVLSKIGAKLGVNERIFARKTVVKKIDKSASDSFLNGYHIYGSVKAKHKLGLFYENELVAVATFSPQRNLNVGRSVELIRFCSKNGTNVIGGLDKLLAFYEKEFQPDHIMTYVDKDWGRGEAFLKLGFEATSEREPIEFYVDTHTGERSIAKLENNCKLKIFNRGSIKLEKNITYGKVYNSRTF